jgi:hypothetical protein
MEEFDSALEQDQWAYYMATRSISAEARSAENEDRYADRYCRGCRTLVEDGPYDYCVACDI